MRVVFLTVFLGLVTGSHEIALQVEGEPAAVELRLDGRAVARVAAPPWTARLELGGELAPHHLEARALDAEGAVRARAEQWLNLPRSPAEVEIHLERGPNGEPSAARVSWASLAEAPPQRVELTFDGRPLDLDPQGRARLPAFDPSAPHLVSAEVVFPREVVARRDLAFGGALGEEARTELTAIALEQPEGGKPPSLSQAAAWLEGPDGPPRLAAIDSGGAEVLLVRGPEAALARSRLGSASATAWTPMGARGPRVRTRDSLRFDARLRRGDQVRFLWPYPRPGTAGGGPPVRLFDGTQPLPAEEAGMLWLLTRVESPAHSGKPRLADAAAVAGLQAAATAGPRAVVLVLGGPAADPSTYPPAVTRRYLESLRVPLFVWALERRPDPESGGWGPAEATASRPALQAAVNRLRAALDRQMVVWLEGRHLPQSIRLTAAARAAGVGFAGDVDSAGGPAPPATPGLAALGERDWVLRAWDAGDPAPAQPEVTLRPAAGRLAGRSGCNQFTAAVEERPAGELVVGPAISTKMACLDAAMAVETRFRAARAAVKRYGLDSAGRLGLTYESGGASRTLLFESRPPE